MCDFTGHCRPLSKRLTVRIGILAMAGACAYACAHDPNDPFGGWAGNFERANLAPGVSVTCYSDPCTAQYKMPDAGGVVHVVRVNNLLAGEFPAAGQVVNLGAYYHLSSPYRFTVDGLNVPAAILWVRGSFP